MVEMPFQHPQIISYGSITVTVVRDGRRIAIRGTAGDKGLVDDCYRGGARWDKNKREFYVGTGRADEAAAIVQRITERLAARQQHDAEVKRRLDAGLLVCSIHTVKVSDELKALGGWWNPDRRCWLMPSLEAKSQAEQLLAPYLDAERKQAAAKEQARKQAAAERAQREAARQSEWRSLVAQYAGTCCVCGERIRAGDRIAYRKSSGARHLDCNPENWNATADGEIVIHGGSGYGCDGWHEGQVLRNPDRYHGSMRARNRTSYDRRVIELAGERPRVYPEKPIRRPNEDDESYEGRIALFRAEEELLADYEARLQAARAQADAEYPLDGPQWLTVLRARRQYVADDGMSFGVGDEQGYVYTAVCRAATPEEAAPAIALQRARKAAARQQAALVALFHRILAEGWAPPDMIELPGDAIYLSKDDHRSVIYGGGRWFVIAGDRAWAVQNNGHDGDDWSRNNVRTGGAGAIGRALPLADLDADEAALLGLWVAGGNDVY